jgi:chromosome segregation ATPase
MTMNHKQAQLKDLLTSENIGTGVGAALGGGLGYALGGKDKRMKAFMALLGAMGGGVGGRYVGGELGKGRAAQSELAAAAAQPKDDNSITNAAKGWVVDKITGRNRIAEAQQQAKDAVRNVESKYQAAIAAEKNEAAKAALISQMNKEKADAVAAAEAKTQALQKQIETDRAARETEAGQQKAYERGVGEYKPKYEGLSKEKSELEQKAREEELVNKAVTPFKGEVEALKSQINTLVNAVKATEEARQRAIEAGATAEKIQKLTAAKNAAEAKLQQAIQIASTETPEAPGRFESVLNPDAAGKAAVERYKREQALKGLGGK